MILDSWVGPLWSQGSLEEGNRRLGVKDVRVKAEKEEEATGLGCKPGNAGSLDTGEGKQQSLPEPPAGVRPC